MSCDVDEVTERLENERKKGWRMSCDVGEVTESLENELSYVTILSLNSPGEPPMNIVFARNLFYGECSVSI